MGGLTEFDAEFKFAKIPNSYVEGGWADLGGGLAEFDAEFKFAKIQNSHFHDPPPTLNMGILDFSKFELSIKFHEGPPPKKMEISVQDWT